MFAVARVSLRNVDFNNILCQLSENSTDDMNGRRRDQRAPISPITCGLEDWLLEFSRGLVLFNPLAVPRELLNRVAIADILGQRCDH